MTRKKKVGNFEKLVTDILDNLDPLVPKGMSAVEVIGALEAAKLILLKKLIRATDLTSLVEGILNDKD
jgi:pilus assembly protein TadC